MTIWTAIIGLAGVLGGAAIGAVTAIYGPSRLHKQQTDSKLAEAEALRNEAAIQRLVALRTTGRTWFEALERVAGDIDAGRVMDLDKFDALILPLRDDTTRSSDALALDGRPPPPSPPFYAMPTSSRDESPPRRDENPLDALTHRGLEAYSDVMTHLRRGSDAVRNDLRRATLGQSTGISKETWQILDATRRARYVFTQSLLAQIETMTAPTRSRTPPGSSSPPGSSTPIWPGSSTLWPSTPIPPSNPPPAWNPRRP